MIHRCCGSRALAITMAWTAITVLTCFGGGCFYVGRETTKDIIDRSPAEWSSRDCLTVVLEAMRNNFLDQSSPNIKVIATAYTPWVVAAINRMSESRMHWSKSESQQDMDAGLLAMAGLYFEAGSNRFVDSHGNFLKNPEQLDSLMFLVTIRNNSWPCHIPIIAIPAGDAGTVGVPAASPSAWPCYIPEITDLAERISLQNDRGLSTRPKYVWGRHNEQLTTEETLLVMFPLRSSKGHLLAKTNSVTLKLAGFDAPVSISFSLENLFPPLANNAR